MKKNFIILSFILLLSCGYQPIHSKKNLQQNYDFSIEKITFSNQKNINQVIKNNLKRYINVENKSKSLILNIDSNIYKKISAKNKQGNPEIFVVEITVNLEVFDNQNLKKKISFKEKSEYKNQANKFNLRQYEKNIHNNLMNQISDDIVLYLYSLK